MNKYKNKIDKNLKEHPVSVLKALLEGLKIHRLYPL